MWQLRQWACIDVYKRQVRRSKDSRKGARAVALYGLLIALAFIFSYVEAMIPVPVPIPGVKPVSYTHLDVYKRQLRDRMLQVKTMLLELEGQDK